MASVSPWRSALLLLVTLQLSCAVLDEATVTSLQETGKFDPSIESHRLDEVSKIQDFKTMNKYIGDRMKSVVKQELAKEGGADEEIEIGNTLKSMEAKHAVEQELNEETKTDCEVGEWGEFAKCDKLCGGGKQVRKREVIIMAKHGGKECPVLENSLDCNVESCESEEHQRRALRRQLTAAEKKRERMANNLKMREAMRSLDTRAAFKKTREVMRKMVHTDLAQVKLPGETGQRSEESLVRGDLKKAMARNAVDNALKSFEKVKMQSQSAEVPQSAQPPTR